MSTSFGLRVRSGSAIEGLDEPELRTWKRGGERESWDSSAVAQDKEGGQEIQGRSWIRREWLDV